MNWQQSVQNAIRALRKDEEALKRELGEVRSRIKDLEQLAKADGPTNARTRGALNRNRLSAEGRAAISRAAKRRWARYRADQRKAER